MSRPAAVDAAVLRTAIIAHLETRPPQSAYAISGAMRQRYPYGAAVPRVSSVLAAMEAAGLVRHVTQRRTRTDKRPAVRWEVAP
jgi:hypothetical protein